MGDINIEISEFKPAPSDYKCAPSKKFEDGSCINLKMLIQMAKAYNENYPSNKIKLSTNIETLNPKKYKQYLLKEFQKRLKNVCENQSCWVKQNFVQKMNKNMLDDLTRNTYRPKGPDGQFTWLNTVNIQEVMEQYEKKYNDFIFLGALPIDFDNLPQLGVRDLDFADLIKKGKTKVGAVFNLDKHNEPGSHWVSVYIDLLKKQIYFFDSYAKKPEARIRKFMRRAARFLQEYYKEEPEVDYNRVRLQFKGSECGMFSLFFIIMMLQGKSFQDVSSSKVYDEEVNKLRQVFFT